MSVISNQKVVWCYICNEVGAGITNHIQELECCACHNTFTEEVGQGVENFLLPTSQSLLSPLITSSNPVQSVIGTFDNDLNHILYM